MVKYYINYFYQFGSGIEGSPCDKITLKRLEQAVLQNNYQWVDKFLNSIVNLNLKDYDMSVTKWALATKKWDIAKILIEHNSNVEHEANVSDPTKDNIIYIAANVGAHRNRVSDKKGFDFIKRFVKINKLNIEEGNGIITPFLLTVQKNHIQTGLELLQYGANIQAVNKKNGNSCLHILAEKSDKVSIEFLRIILEYLHKYSEDNKEEKKFSNVLDFIKLMNNNKRTALDLAESEQNEKAVILLKKSIEAEENRINQKIEDLKFIKSNKGNPFSVVDRLPNALLKVLKEEKKLREEESKKMKQKNEEFKKKTVLRITPDMFET